MKLSQLKIFIFFLFIACLLLFFWFVRTDHPYFFLGLKEGSREEISQFLKNKNRKFTFRDGEFFLEKEDINLSLLVSFLEEINPRDSYRILSESEETKEGFLNLYLQKLLRVSKKMNPHLKYKIGLTKDPMVINIEVSDVIKRDNIEKIHRMMRGVLISLAPIEIKVFNDTGQRIHLWKYGLKKGESKKRYILEKEVRSFLSSLVKGEDIYILFEDESNKSLDILIKNHDEFTLEERKILSAGIRKKIGDAYEVNLKNISNIASISLPTESSKKRSKFLLLLFLTIICVLTYLFSSYYLAKKRKKNRLRQERELAFKKAERERELEQERDQLCLRMEHQILHKEEESSISIENYLKKREGVFIDQWDFSTGEVCYIVIKNLNNEVKSLIFEKLGRTLVERIISFSGHENVLGVSLEGEVYILRHFLEYLENHNELVEFEGSFNKTGEITRQWNESHYVNLIKKRSTQREFPLLLRFFKEENPLMTSLIFVSLNEALQEEVWTVLPFEEKEKLSFSLFSAEAMDRQKIKNAYEVFSIFK